MSLSNLPLALCGTLLTFVLASGPAYTQILLEGRPGSPGTQATVFSEDTAMSEGRERMVSEQIEQRGIRDPAVLAAMRRVPRHGFVPADLAGQAYRDSPLPIGLDQTISQPYIVAFMTEALRVSPDDRVLEVGAGSGYQAAVLAELVREVFTIEIVEPLAQSAAERLKSLGYTNITVIAGDGYKGWPDRAPFDAIIVTAAAPHVPQPLIDQLKPGGRMVIPVGPTYSVQYLLLIRKADDGTISQEKLLPVRFVPLTGDR
jgi:protein-L-isoaspartate(D-aspartate) O-methyltransferase